ncbi:MAG: thioredoxin [Fusobacteriaceae bacterium]|jgi:thioredoxin 1|nr:thioredoxin [Fusobacteriaceae bacterium]
MYGLVNLNDSTFDAGMFNPGQVVLLEFWADWCGPCKVMGPIVEEISKETQTTVYKVDVDDNPGLAGRFGIKSVPSMVILKEGKAVDQLTGLISRSQLKEILSKHCA